MLKREDLFKRATAPGKLGGGAALLERLGRGRDLRKRVTWPGGTLELDLQVLSRGETADALSAAVSACTARGIDQASTSVRAVEARTDEEITQILARAIRDAETGRPLFASAEELASIATDDELVALFNAYADHRHDVDPDLGEMPEEEFRALEDALKKKDETRFNSIVSTMPRAWLRTSVFRLVTSQTDRSSSTSDSSPPALPSDPPPGA